MNSQERMGMYREAIVKGRLTINQVREAEGLSPVECEDGYFVSIASATAMNDDGRLTH